MARSLKGGKLGILVGGGPAPGIKGVIASLTIEAINQGIQVVCFQNGFRHLVEGSDKHNRPLTAEGVEPYYLTGGSILGTARTNPAKKEEHMQKVLEVFQKLGISALVTIGGDDTAYSASQVAKRVGPGSDVPEDRFIRVAHVPKTIDNDLPLPEGTPTFGFETARHLGVGTARALATDAATTSRWYIVVSMGRAAGHLALGIGKASAATVTIIPEGFRKQKVTLEAIADLIIGSILKRKLQGKEHGLAVLAEGLIESVGEEGLLSAVGGEKELARYGRLVRDDHNHLRLGEIEFGRLAKDYVQKRLGELGQKMDFIDKDLGYELRSADPIPFDAEYTRDLGYGAVKFLFDDKAALQFGAVISFVDGALVPLPFEEMIDPRTQRMKPRKVNVEGESFQCAKRYMTRLLAEDFADAEKLEELRKLTRLTTKEFRERFEPLTLV